MSGRWARDSRVIREFTTDLMGQISPAGPLAVRSPPCETGTKLRWKKNRGGLKRTIEEALAIARSNGVEVPEDVEFFEAEPGELEGSRKGFFAGQRFETARGPRVKEHEDGRIYWQDHYNKDGKVPFRIHPDVLTSDEAVIAVFQHEMHELSLLREVFIRSKTGSMNGTDYGLQTAEGRPRTFTIWRGSRPTRSSGG